MSSVYIHKRPIKTVFLVNPTQTDWQEQIDAIWRYCQDKWGGRYNPIVPTDGETIDENWWYFLTRLDPDFIISVFPLQENLIEEIKSRLRPIDIELPRNFGDSSIKPSINSRYDGVSIFPSSSNLSKFAKLISNDVLASIREFDGSIDTNIFRFLLRNLGVFQQIYDVDKILEKIEKKKSFEINNISDLIPALGQLSQYSEDFVYPIQYSMLGKPEWYIELENTHSNNVFGLIIGDTFDEQIFLKNKIFYERDFRHNRISHLWLPEVLTEDSQLMADLSNWIRMRHDFKEIHLFSFSLSENKLKEIGDKLDGSQKSGIFINQWRKSITVFESFPFPKYVEDQPYSFWNNYLPPISHPKDCDIYRVNSLSESFEIKSPHQSEGISARGYWMAEIYIQSDINRFYNYKYDLSDSQNFWWKLPRKNYLPTKVFKRKSRINYKGIPVVPFNEKDPVLSINLPDEIKLLKDCILGDRMGKMAGQVKRKTLEVSHVEFSNIGKYLSGFLEVFGGLGTANNYLRERYWRNIFDILSGRDLRKDSTINIKVRNKLNKKIKEGRTAGEIINDFENLCDFGVFCPTPRNGATTSFNK